MERKERYHELCRLCASYDAVTMDIFGQEGRNRQLVDKIQTCLPFKIAEDDRLPKCLCYRCMYNLENFYDFRTACVNAVALLERCLPTIEGADAKNGSKSQKVLFKEKENMPVLIPEAPIVNPNAALGTPPRLNSDGEADHEIEEILENEATDEEGIDELEDRKSEEYEMDMETNPSDFLEMTSMVPEENDESDSRNTPTAVREPFRRTSEQHEVYVCSLCNKAFSSKGHLSLHARIHVGAGDVIGEKVITDDHTSYKRPFQCDLCNKSYSTAKHRWGHVSTTHRGHPAVTCSYCSRIYSTRTNLEEHIKSRHAGLPTPQELPTPFVQNRVQCKTCPKTFPTLADLNTHNRLCAGDHQTDAPSKSIIRKFAIDASDLSSVDSDADNKDYKTAEAKLSKNPQLTILKQALTKDITLKRDSEDGLNRIPIKMARTDNGDIGTEKKWYCESCPRSFTSIESLKQHEKVHEADKPFICILCNKDFALKSSLSRHILTLHGVDPVPIIDSDKCLKKTINTPSWDEPTEITCKQEASSPKLERDGEESIPENMIEIETVFVCEICTRDFNDRASLWLHIRATHKEFAAFACGVCLKICSDNTQLLNHVNMYHGGSKLLVSEQRRYSCTICGRQHDSRKKLIAHVSIHNVDPAYDPANFVQLNSNYYNENSMGVEGSEHLMDFDGEDEEKVDCYICYKSFPSEDHLIRHQRNAHKSEQAALLEDPSGNSSNASGTGNRAQYHLFFVCELCGSSHPSKWERWLHVSSVHGNEPSIKCERDACGKIFATKSLRNEHAQHHLIQGESPNTCEICGKLWGSRVDYWKHVMGVHSDTVPLICGVCLKVFPDVGQLSAHVKTNHWPLTNGDFSCDICGRPYSNKSKMSRHRKIHGLLESGDNYENGNTLPENDSAKMDNLPLARLPENDMSCELCADMKFSNLDELCQHRRAVHGLFPCDLCNKCYGRTSHLWKHVNRVHKGHEDVTCRYCLKTSASRDHLAAHIAKIHRYEPDVTRKQDSKSRPNIASNNINVNAIGEDGSILHYCEKCNKGFHKRYLLRRHMKGCQNYRKDPGALLTRCRACERIFKDRASLRKHIENHHSTYTCHLCDETVTSKLGIMTHNRVKHMNHPDLTCDQCKKLFRTKEDLESHRKDHKYHGTPNVCDFCGDTVENKLKLKMHVLSLHRNEIGVSCGVCLIPMKDPKDLKKHVEDAHESILSRPNTCQVCGKQYASKWKAFDHTKKCHGKVFRTCKQCLAVFTSDSDIRDHYEFVHNVSKDQLLAFEYPTDMGSKADEYENGPSLPLDIAVKEEPDDLDGYDEDPCDDDSNECASRSLATDTHDCEMCPEIFLDRGTLAEHYKNVHNTDPVRMFGKFQRNSSASSSKKKTRINFECENCKKQFYTKTAYWKHISDCVRDTDASLSHHQPDEQGLYPRNNNEIKKEGIDLNIPDFNLFEDINLQLSGHKPLPHLVPLSETKSMSTSGTSGKCSRKDSRKVYDESTNTECTCEVCGKQWPAKKHLWQHLIRFHRSEAAVTCGVCLKLCSSYKDLANHLDATHAAILSCEGNNFTCKTCGRYHNARSKLLLHTSIHINYNGNYWCQKCRHNFENEAQFTEHKSTCEGSSDTTNQQKNDSANEKSNAIEDETLVMEDAEEMDFESEGESDDNSHSRVSNSENTDNSDDSSDTASNASSSDDEVDEDEDEEDANDVNNVEENGDVDNPEKEGNKPLQNNRLSNVITYKSETDELESDEESDSKEYSNEKQYEQSKSDSSYAEQRTSRNDSTAKDTNRTTEEDKNNLEVSDDDDGPPVLSPMMPILSNKGDEDDETEDRRRHDLSPIVPLSVYQRDDKDSVSSVEISKNPQTSGTSPGLFESTRFYEGIAVNADRNPNVVSRFHRLNSKQNEVVEEDRMSESAEVEEDDDVVDDVDDEEDDDEDGACDGDDNGNDDEEDDDDHDDDDEVDDDDDNEKNNDNDHLHDDDDDNDENEVDDNMQMAVTMDQDDVESVDRYSHTGESAEDPQEDTLEENMDDEMEVNEDDEDEVHELDGTMLMVTNDVDGNPIFIQQNVIEDSEEAVYIYDQGDERYEIEGYELSQGGTTATLQAEEMEDNSSVQEEHEDSDDEKAEVSGLPRTSAKIEKTKT